MTKPDTTADAIHVRQCNQCGAPVEELRVYIGDRTHGQDELAAERDALQQRVERLRNYGGKLLRAYRMHHRVSMGAVARYLRISVASVSAYETGDPNATTRADAMTDEMALQAQRWIGGDLGGDLGDETGEG